MHDNIFVFFGWVIPTLALFFSAIATCNNFSAEAAAEKQQRQIDSLIRELRPVKRSAEKPASQGVPILYSPTYQFPD